ncbi:MAG: hypothetical protein QME79_04245 [Bacillota bacterium]|nr:hypothetical protein [Bacillota bacterium]
MRRLRTPVRDWTDHLVGLTVETACVSVLLSLAGLIAWMVTRK